MGRLATCAFVIAVVALPSALHAQSDELRERVGCEPVAVVRTEREIVVACSHHLSVIDARTGLTRWHGPSSERIVALERDQRGEIAVITAERRRAPLGVAITTLGRPARSDGRVGRVEESERDRAMVRVGEGIELRVGDALAFVITSAAGGMRVATGTVEHVEARIARVRLGLGERAPAGAEARRIDVVDHPLWAPPRIADRVVLRASVDGLVPVGTGGGAMLSLDAAWHLEAPVVLRAGVAPLALGASNGLGGIFAGLGYLSAGVDLDWLELSLGAAATTMNQRPRGQATSAFATVLGARLGASEGFSAEAQLFFTIDDVGLDLGVGRLRLTLPVTRAGTKIVHRADIGRHGVLRVDAGVVTFLDGRGDRGSLALGVFLGFGHLYYQRVCAVGACARAIVVSPTVGLELDWRP